MSNYPLDMAERQQIRERILEQQLAKARREANELGRSYKCGMGYHADPETTGCQNKGDGCICECHDAVDVVPARVS